MSMHNLVAQATAGAGDGLTLTQVVRDIPHDPAAFVVYALVIGSVALVVWAGRNRPDSGAPPTEAQM